MTYGENGGQLRAELTTLLRQHRIQQRLGGPGSFTMPTSTTVEQRRLLGQQIQRYRHAAVSWCLGAVAAASPQANLEGAANRSRSPAHELHRRLTQSINASEVRLPSLDELSAPQEFTIVESWRQIARAAALGEHDFPRLMDHGRLSDAQAMTVLKDAAEVTRALVVLDQRYKNIPGWIPFQGRGWLDRAAQACSTFASTNPPDYSVDHMGWRPPPATIDGAPLTGIAGVLQAQHNMLVHLGRFPNALNLRRVLDSQRVASHEAARLTPKVGPELTDRWVEREQTYQRLIDQTRNVGGLIGNGGPAAAEAANAVGRLRRLHLDHITSPEPLRHLDKLFTRTDARVATIIEQGMAERRYLVTAKIPRIVDGTGQLVSPARQRYAPITAPVQNDLTAVVRNQLRPPPVVPVAPPGAQDKRETFRESIEHRPVPRAGPTR